ncbi:MAG: hypothetical protein ABSC19_04825 [Syntrophorhabdales bacterium]|jgi:hypothetical protein
MLRVCVICKTVFGCYRGKAAHRCDSCELSCEVGKRAVPRETMASHGMCDACFENRPKLSFGTLAAGQ